MMIDYARHLPTFTRLLRRLRGRCVVCGNHIHRFKGEPCWWYCSMTCACYDGTMSVRWQPERVLPKPSVWRGCTQRWQPKEEKYL